MFFAALALGLLVYAHRCSAFNFHVSQVRECEPVVISFNGNSNASVVPSWLTLIPFDSVPTSIPIPHDATVSSGITVTNFPFSVGTTFLVTLQDASGRIATNTSDILTVLPSSSSNNSSCLPQATLTAPNPYVIIDSLSQCKNFTIQYNTTLVPQAPSVNMFNAHGPGLPLNLTKDDRASGTATYLLSFPHGRHVLLIFDGGAAGKRTTPLMNIGGSSDSSQTCLVRAGVITSHSDTSPPSNTSSTSTSTSSTPVSKNVIIASVVTAAGVFLTIAASMVVFLLRQRRRVQSNDPTFEPVLIEKGLPDSPRSTSSPPLSVSNSPKHVVNPLYTSERFVSPTSSSFSRRASHPSIKSTRIPPSNFEGTASASSTSLSINLLDIEGMLNLASVQTSRISRASSVPRTPVVQSPFYPSPSSLPPPLPQLDFPPIAATPKVFPSSPLDPVFAVQRCYPFRGHMRAPPDVPTGPGSILSSFSTDPFTDNMSIAGPARPSRPRTSYRSISLDLSIRPPPRPPRGPEVRLGSPFDPSSPLSSGMF